MNREKGVSSLALVLMLLVLGSLLLQGMSQQDRSFASRVSMESQSLWRTGEVIDGNIVFSPRGWSDFCPLKERALCQLP